ncbi:hypothetical protein V2J09_018814 [Rumex salicifolius]
MASRMITTAWPPPTSNTNTCLRLLGSGAGKGCSFTERKAPAGGRVSAAVQETTAGVEMKLEGEGPWKLYDDVDVIFTSGVSLPFTQDVEGALQRRSSSHRRRVSFKDLDEKNSALKAFLESKNFAD